MNKELVSIIIPIYNVEHYLKKCIESCINQKYKNIEIILVDDGSPDNSGNICDEYKKKDSRIIVIHKKNGGVSSARNEGMKFAKGKWITFIDADDYISPLFIKYMVDLVKKSNGEFALSRSCYISKHEKQNEEKISILNAEEATALLLSQNVLVGCWNKIYNKKFLENNNITFSTELFFGEGLEFITRVSQKASKVVVGNKKEYFYRKNNEGSATVKFNIKKYYNGEKSLNYIYENMSINSKEIDKQMKIHYTMFYLNTIIDIIMTNNKKKYLEDYKRWKNIIKNNKKDILLYPDVTKKDKFKVILACYCPFILKRLRNIRRKQLHKHSV